MCWQKLFAALHGVSRVCSRTAEGVNIPVGAPTGYIHARDAIFRGGSGGGGAACPERRGGGKKSVHKWSGNKLYNASTALLTHSRLATAVCCLATQDLRRGHGMQSYPDSTWAVPADPIRSGPPFPYPSPSFQPNGKGRGGRRQKADAVCFSGPSINAVTSN